MRTKIRHHEKAEEVSVNMAQFIIILEQLAAQADTTNLVPAGGPALPNGWVLLNLVSVTVPSFIPIQGFLASGPADSTGTQVAVLAMGMTWQNYMYGQVDGTMYQGPIPAVIGGTGMPAGAQFLSVFVSAYNAGRPVVWNTLNFLGKLPLYICGMGLGGPLAQIAALDLRPGNTGPSGQDSPALSSPCYVFSTANAGNQTFAGYFTSKVSSTILWAGNNQLQVDLFPTSPNDGANFVPSGTIQNILSYIPQMDEPWLERSDIYYLTALGGTPAAVTAVAGSVTTPPLGFSQVTASTLATLTVAAYQQAQHTGSIVNIDPYQLAGIVYSLGVPYAYIFRDCDTVVVAFRGCVTYADFNTITCNSNFATPSFDSNKTAHVHAGAYGIYSSPIVQGSTVTFAQSLQSTLSALTNVSKLYLTGHSLGGTIANLAAADYAMNQPSIRVTGIYTFGSILVGDYSFAQDFNGAVTAGSYQVVRTADKIYNSIQRLGYASVNNQVILNGNLAVDESTCHSLYGYAGLLSPWGPPSW